MDTKSSKTHSPLLSPTSNRSPKRKSNNACTSPEFEFWMPRNLSLPHPNILSADQLFLDGVILPLHLISTKPDPKPDDSDQVPNSSPAITDCSTITTISKRWKNIFSKKNNNNTEEKVKKKEKNIGKGGCGGDSSSSERYINIWPFSRSKSAKNSVTRPKSAPVSRKVNSAPCSRSNSAGDSDSKSRKFPSSPGRVGVHIGRSSPVWRRGGSIGKNTEPLNMKTNKSHRKRLAASSASGGGGNAKAQVLNLNVPLCGGYSHRLGCRIEESSGSSKLFNLRNFFTKKTVLTV
ncbi:unnamed protein product [Lathyrus sativus]|nr:unnamed protein product [Lathyrus sativus]